MERWHGLSLLQRVGQRALSPAWVIGEQNGNVMEGSEMGAVTQEVPDTVVE